MKTFTKEELIEQLQAIRGQGWIKSARPGNQGSVGNTLEDLLGIIENNLPIPNAAEWELKCQRDDAGSLTTLFHMEPSPRALKFVPAILLPKYGWRHQEAGSKYKRTEMSFRQTIDARSRSDRGFCVVVNRRERKICISFDAPSVDTRHTAWLEDVKHRVGLTELNPQPYWGFDDIFHKAASKLHNCFFIRASTKKESGVEYFWYKDIMMLKGVSEECFITSLEAGLIKVDFDARTGHNHGTKFRFLQNRLPELYSERIRIE